MSISEEEGTPIHKASSAKYWSVEISGIIALESLNSLIYFCVKATNMLIVILEEAEKALVTELELPD